MMWDWTAGVIRKSSPATNCMQFSITTWFMRDGVGNILSFLMLSSFQNLHQVGKYSRHNMKWNSCLPKLLPLESWGQAICEADVCAKAEITYQRAAVIQSSEKLLDTNPAVETCCLWTLLTIGKEFSEVSRFNFKRNWGSQFPLVIRCITHL